MKLDIGKFLSQKALFRDIVVVTAVIGVSFYCGFRVADVGEERHRPGMLPITGQRAPNPSGMNDPAPSSVKSPDGMQNKASNMTRPQVQSPLHLQTLIKIYTRDIVKNPQKPVIRINFLNLLVQNNQLPEARKQLAALKEIADLDDRLQERVHKLESLLNQKETNQ